MFVCLVADFDFQTRMLLLDEYTQVSVATQRSHCAVEQLSTRRRGIILRSTYVYVGTKFTSPIGGHECLLSDLIMIMSGAALLSELYDHHYCIPPKKQFEQFKSSFRLITFTE